MVDFSEIEKKDTKFLNVKIHVFTISKNLKHIMTKYHGNWMLSISIIIRYFSQQCQSRILNYLLIVCMGIHMYTGTIQQGSQQR